MIGKALQGDWLLVSAPAGGVVTQSQSTYQDLGDYDDVSIYLECTREDGTGMSPLLSWQTSPTPNDDAFENILAPMAMSVTTTPIVTTVLAGYSLVPLARYLRWQITCANAWQACFRVHLAAYAPGT